MKAHKVFVVAWGLALLLLVGNLCLGTHLAQALSARFGGTILRAAQGKIADAAVTVFIQNRMSEMLWLTALALLWATLHRLFEIWRRKPGRFVRYRWAIHGGAGFVFLNLWIAAASNTALFWGVMGTGAGIENLMQFELKRILLEEHPGAHRAVLVGNSQTRAQIDEDQLNAILGPRLWTTELHWPGSQAFDLLLVEHQFRRANPELVICYLTEGFFYGGTKGESVPPFFGFRDIPDWIRRGGFHQLPGDKVFYGALGNLMPLFRCREIVAQRFLGDATVNLKQVEYNTSLQTDLNERAKIMASAHRNDSATEFQKQALEDFVVRCQQANRRVILVAGQSNPIADRQLDPALHPDMLSYLEQLKSRHSNIILISPNETPIQAATDYEDLTHVNKEAQKRFTIFLAGRLGKLLEEPPIAKR
jgi:hypothetical protein